MYMLQCTCVEAIQCSAQKIYSAKTVTNWIIGLCMHVRAEQTNTRDIWKLLGILGFSLELLRISKYYPGHTHELSVTYTEG